MTSKTTTCDMCGTLVPVFDLHHCQNLAEVERRRPEDDKVLEEHGFELNVIVDPAETRPRIVRVGEPELIGRMTPRTDLPVQKDPTRKVGFTVHTVTGTDLYRLPEGFDPEKMDITDAWDVMKDENLVTTEDGLNDGDRVLVQDLFALQIGVIGCDRKGQLTCTSENGKKLYFIQFVNDRPEPAPPRWVCTGSGNLAAIQKLELNP